MNSNGQGNPIKQKAKEGKEMKQSLQERCEAQIRNETAMREVAKLEHEAVLKLCAMMHVNASTAPVAPIR